MSVRTIIYARQSLDRSGDQLAVSRQLDVCREYATERGWDVSGELVDNDVSATSGTTRPAFEALLADPPDRVVVWHVDRLIRLTRDLERVIDTGLSVHAVKAGHVDLSNPAGRAVARTITAWATYEGEQKAERQKASNDQRATAGLPPAGGRRCYGYTPDGMEVVEKEAAHVRKAARLILDGVPMRTAMRIVTEDGMRTTTGGLWQGTGFRRYITNPRLVAQRMHRGEVVADGVWPPILTPEEHTGLVAILSDPSRRAKGRPRTYLLSGVARCGTCGAKIYGRVERRGPIYVCQSRAHLGRKIADIDDHVETWVVALLSMPDAARLFTDPESADEATRLQAEHRRLTGRLDDLAEAYAAGEITRKQLTVGTARLRERIADIDSTLPSLATTPALAGLIGADDVLATWEGLAVAVRRELIGALAEITIHPAGRGARKFDPDTVEIRRRKRR